MTDRVVKGLRDRLEEGSVLEFVASDTVLSKIEKHLSGGEVKPAVPKRAATVMLLREAEADFEVFMMRRASTMEFVPDAVVFPGGSVDALDYGACPWHGPAPSVWAAAIGCDEDTASAVVVAAVRELFEECGVLLASHGDLRLLDTEEIAACQEARKRLVKHEDSLVAFLKERGLVLRADLLGLQSRWTTPEYENRRYDTCFFVARIPAGQCALGDSSESSGSAWVRPSDVLSMADQGKARVLPPTVSNLSALTRVSDVQDLLTVGKVPSVMLRPAMREDGVVVMRSVVG